MSRIPLQKISDNVIRKSFEVFEDLPNDIDEIPHDVKHLSNIDSTTKRSTQYSRLKIESMFEKMKLQKQRIEKLEEENTTLKQLLRASDSSIEHPKPSNSDIFTSSNKHQPMDIVNASVKPILSSTPQKRSRIESDELSNTDDIPYNILNISGSDKSADIKLPAMSYQEENVDATTNSELRHDYNNNYIHDDSTSNKTETPPPLKTYPIFPSMNRDSSGRKVVYESISSEDARKEDIATSEKEDNTKVSPASIHTEEISYAQKSNISFHDRVKLARESSIKVLFRNVQPIVELTELQRKRQEYEQHHKGKDSDFILPIGDQSMHGVVVPLTDLPHVQEKIHMWKESYHQPSLSPHSNGSTDSTTRK